MKNLKKALCLVMTVAMLMSVMVFTTSAADFTDSDEIVNSEAVDTMTALNIINGKGDGSYFDPTGIVTRAEMAKMICVALNGGKDPQLGTAAYSFTDTVGNWAAGYIEYCYNLGIVSGRGNGIFDPTGTVTGTEAAKMLLVAIGYDAAAEGFTGASWAMAVNVKANQKDLYDELDSMDISAGLTRDNAAQMVYNAINAVMVVYDYKLVTGSDGALATVAVAEDDEDDATILSEKFGMDTVYAYMTAISAYNEDTGKYTYEFTDAITGGAVESEGGTDYDPFSFSSANDYTNLFGSYVRVLYKTSSSGTITPFGVYDANETFVTATFGEITSATNTNTYLKINSTKYTVDGTCDDVDVYYYEDGVLKDATDKTLDLVYTDNKDAFDESSKIILVSGDDENTKIDHMVVIPSSVAKVTYVGSDTVTAGASYDLDDDVIYDGIAKNDYALIVKDENSFDGKNHLTEVEVITGTVTGTKTSSSKAMAQVGGTWYTEYVTGGTTLTLESTYDLYVVGKYYYYADKTSAGSVDELLYVSGYDTPSSMGNQDAKVTFSDGTTSVISVIELAADGKSDTADINKTTNYLGNGTTDEGLYTYSLSSGSYCLTPVDDDNDLGYTDYDATITKYDAVNNRLGGGVATTYIADDAVIFIEDKDGVDVITGAAIKAWSDNSSNDFGTSGAALTKTVSGLRTAKVILLSDTTDTASGVGSTNYGYVLSTPYLTTVDGTKYTCFSVWTGSETITVYDEDLHYPSIRTPISYAVVSGQFVDEVTSVGTAVAITGYNGEDIVVEDATGAVTSGLIDDDETVILYVNSTTPAGVEGGDLAVAGTLATGEYILNAYYYDTDSNDIPDLIVYDVNNDLYNLSNVAGTGATDTPV